MKKLGLIAGTGDLPKVIASSARAKGYRVIAIALDSLTDISLSSYVDEIKWVNVGKFGQIINYFKKSDVKEAVMVGKVSKSLLYKSKITPDLRAIKLLFSLKDRKDDTILLAITEELQREGVKLLKITNFSSDILTPEGILTKSEPSDNEWKDIKFGFRIAKEIGKLDIGQTVVVKDQAVMAVEAIEGTDEAIKRGGELAGPGVVVAKVSKPNQDMRFDVPVAGLNTLKSMIDVNARVLCLEAQKCIILEKDKLIKEADYAGIVIVGYKE